MASPENSAKNARFHSFSDIELDNIISEKDSKNTKDVIKHAVNVLRHYCTERNTSIADVEQKSPVELCEFLRIFYAKARQATGELYASLRLSVP